MKYKKKPKQKQFTNKKSVLLLLLVLVLLSGLGVSLLLTQTQTDNRSQASNRQDVPYSDEYKDLGELKSFDRTIYPDGTEHQVFFHRNGNIDELVWRNGTPISNKGQVPTYKWSAWSNQYGDITKSVSSQAKQQLGWKTIHVFFYDEEVMNDGKLMQTALIREVLDWNNTKSYLIWRTGTWDPRKQSFSKWTEWSTKNGDLAKIFPLTSSDGQKNVPVGLSRVIQPNKTEKQFLLAVTNYGDYKYKKNNFSKIFERTNATGSWSDWKDITNDIVSSLPSQYRSKDSKLNININSYKINQEYYQNNTSIQTIRIYVGDTKEISLLYRTGTWNGSEVTNWSQWKDDYASVKKYLNN